MYIEGVRASLATGPAANLPTLIDENKAGFALIRTAFASAFVTYQTQARSIARDILQLVFFVRRGSPRDIIKQEVRERIDTIHELLGLDEGQACIGPGHPLLGEYAPVPTDCRLRFFPESGLNGVTIAKASEGSETHAFIEALGKQHCKCPVPIFRNLPDDPFVCRKH